MKRSNLLLPAGPSLALCLLLACGGKSQDPTSKDPNVPRTVSGDYVTTYVSPSGEAPRPVDLSAATVQALVPDGKGGYSTLAGTGRPDGGFSIPNVPQGDYLLLVKPSPTAAPRMVWTSGSEIHLGGVGLGRADWVAATQSTTKLEVNWPTYSGSSAVRYQVVVPSLGRASYLDTASSLATKTTWGFPIGTPLIEAAKDPVTFTRLDRQTQSNGDKLYTIQGTGSALPFSTVDGAVSTLSPQFTGASGTWDRISVDVDRNAFAAYVVDANPSATVINPEFRLEAHPAGLSKGHLYGAPQLLSLQSSSNQGRWQGGPYDFVNPFLSSWPQVVTADVVYDRQYTVPGSGKTFRSGAVYSAVWNRADLGVGPLTPSVSPVRNLRLNGRSLFQNQLGVGATPTIAWDAPALGTPDDYYLLIDQIDDSGSYVTIGSSWVINTKGLSLTLPPGILETGKNYVFVIWAIKCANYDPRYPFRTGGLPYCSAPALSEVVVP